MRCRCIKMYQVDQNAHDLDITPAPITMVKEVVRWARDTATIKPAAIWTTGFPASGNGWRLFLGASKSFR